MPVRIAILAQDLIWSDRLARAVQAAGAESVPSATMSGFERTLLDCPLAIVDLTARAYDPMVAIERARTSGARVLAVGQHDDVDLRKLAMARGADRVFAYRKLFETGPTTIAAWIERTRPAGVTP